MARYAFMAFATQVCVLTQTDGIREKKMSREVVMIGRLYPQNWSASRPRFFSIVVAVEEVGVDGSSESSPINKEDLLAHLNAFPKNRLVEEVVSMWEELGELERELAMARQRARALDGELVNVRSKSGGRADLAELEERFRVAEARRSQLETMLANEQGRRKDLEEVVGEGRVDELRRENAALIRREEEHMLLILDMESKIDQLMEIIAELQNNA